jgi:hypothetical protein
MDGLDMRKFALISVFLIGSMSVPLAAGAADTVVEFSGSGNTTTSIFTVESPWLLDWRLDGDYDKLIALDITLVEARTGKHVGRILHTKRKGNGLKLFKHSGQYQLRISSTLAQWTIKVQQIQPDEEELYTPRKSN